MTPGASHNGNVEGWVERLRAHAGSGEVLDLAAGFPEDSKPRRPDQADDWAPDRRIPAAALRAVLTDPDLVVDPHGLRISGARIPDPLDLGNVTFEHALHLTSCRIDRGIDLRGATLKELRLDGSQIATLNLDDVTVSSSVFARTGFRTEGEFRANGASIGGQFDLSGATLTNPDGIALNLDGATVAGRLLARNGFRAQGQVMALGATIGGSLELDGATLTNLGGTALNLEGATVTGNLFLRNGFESVGMVRALNAIIGGQLNLDRATLTNPGNTALDLEGAKITGGLFLRDRFKAEGQVRALNTSIGGQIILSGATLTNADGYALVLDGASITGGLFADDGFRADGMVRAPGASIGGQIILSGATLTNADGYALVLDGASITGGVYAGTGFGAEGEVRATGASIGRLDLSGATLANPGGDALYLARCTVGALDLRGLGIEGEVNLVRATITDLITPDDDRPPGTLSATGWQITDVHGKIRTDWKTAAKWLDSTPGGTGFTSQPWHAVAAVYDRNGQPADARRLRFTAANRTTTHAPRYSKLLRWTYLVTAGHGYYPLLAAAWLLLALVTATTIVGLNAPDFTATGLGPPSLAQAGAIAAANVLPAAGGSKPVWTVAGDASVVIWTLLALRVASWIFVAILLAGVTGLLRKT